MRHRVEKSRRSFSIASIEAATTIFVCFGPENKRAVGVLPSDGENVYVVATPLIVNAAVVNSRTG